MKASACPHHPVTAFNLARVREGMEPACDNDGMKGGLNLRREWGNLSDPGKKEEGGKAGFSAPPGH